MRVLAFDISSTHIGWVLLVDGEPRCWGEINVDRSSWKLWRRLVEARRHLVGLVAKTRPDEVAIEAPALSYYQKERQVDEQGKRSGPGIQGLIAQQRMVGVVIEVCTAATGREELAVLPTQAKQALTGTSWATKEQMIYIAVSELGELVSEHVADALGVGRAAAGVLRKRQLAAQAKKEAAKQARAARKKGSKKQ